MLSEETKRTYIDYPYFCPYCKSTNITAGHFEGESSSLIVKCDDCKKHWIELFELKSIEEVGD